ncbi:MAG: xanthine phosphoribosyltransferase [Clostridia bacterium]|nr:xanthine phosphoribosyltransferase [Clostridia bacterium]
MNFLEQRIAHDGRALDGSILLVDSFINHQVDMELMQRVGHAFAEYFHGRGIARVLTVESSGIAPAGMTALSLSVPLVVLKKKASRITGESVYQAAVRSYTKNVSYQLTVSKSFMPAGEKVLFVDDFLATGQAALGVHEIVKESCCELAGIGIVIEKTFQPGRSRLDSMGIDVFSLARVERMSDQGIWFVQAE